MGSPAARRQADADALGTNTYGTFNYADERHGGASGQPRREVFPSCAARAPICWPAPTRPGMPSITSFPGRSTKTALKSEVINHLGRHELHGYIPRSLTDDPNLVEHYRC